MLYTDHIRNAVAGLETKAPKGFVADILEAGDPPYLVVRFYEGQWLLLDPADREQAANYLVDLTNLIRSHNVDATLLMVQGVPK